MRHWSPLEKEWGRGNAGKGTGDPCRGLERTSKALALAQGTCPILPRVNCSHQAISPVHLSDLHLQLVVSALPLPWLLGSEMFSTPK